MTMRLDVQVLRVFTDSEGGHGNELGVVFDAAQLPSELGIRLTAHLGFSETVFVDDLERASFRIFTPTAELRLAGHPTVGAAWVLAERTGAVPQIVRPRLASPVPTWQSDDGLVWIRGAIAEAPQWEFVQLDKPEQVDALEVDPDGRGKPAGPRSQRWHHQFWAWIDEEAGVLRARTFGMSVGVPEDEATGSAAIRLAHLLGRPITIRQGRGSVIEARPSADPGQVEIGGAVVSDGQRVVTL